jgi:hypothetical protein
MPQNDPVRPAGATHVQVPPSAEKQSHLASIVAAALATRSAFKGVPGRQAQLLQPTTRQPAAPASDKSNYMYLPTKNRTNMY